MSSNQWREVFWVLDTYIHNSSFFIWLRPVVFLRRDRLSVSLHLADNVLNDLVDGESFGLLASDWFLLWSRLCVADFEFGGITLLVAVGCGRCNGGWSLRITFTKWPKERVSICRFLFCGCLLSLPSTFSSCLLCDLSVSFLSYFSFLVKCM